MKPNSTWEEKKDNFGQQPKELEEIGKRFTEDLLNTLLEPTLAEKISKSSKTHY